MSITHFRSGERGGRRKLQPGLAEPRAGGYNHASLGLVAQLVEQRIENPCVGGSIPPRATKIQENATPRVAFFICAHENGAFEFFLPAQVLSLMRPVFCGMLVLLLI
jgi:hypothetical protein